jgi:CHASE1-domain containing sensor protein
MQFLKTTGNNLRQFLPCILAATIGIAASVTSAAVIVQRDNNDAERQFNVLAENHFMVLQNGLNEYVNRLHAVRALFDSSAESVTRNEFDANRLCRTCRSLGSKGRPASKGHTMRATHDNA